ncbi:MAG: anti-sigma factor [Deltaproteobacteria bacterium]|nr:MAG: anti-sigma factor [Deltaproteobacteria bacterium]
MVTLRGVGSSPRATGRVIWNQAAGGWLFVANLPSVPQGKAYVLWMNGAGSPRPAGVFRVDGDGRTTHHVAPGEGAEPIEAFAVTLEPERGVPAPTGPRVLASGK